MTRKKLRDYSMIKDDLPTKKVEPSRIRRIGSIDIDYSVFKKSKAERLILKLVKARSKHSTINNK